MRLTKFVLLLSLAPTVGCSRRIEPFQVSVDWAHPRESTGNEESPRFQDLDSKCQETSAGSVLGKPSSLPGLRELQERIAQIGAKAALLSEQSAGSTAETELASNTAARDLEELDAAVATLEKILGELTKEFAGLKEQTSAHQSVVEERLAELGQMIQALERRLDGETTSAPARIIPASALKTVPTPIPAPASTPTPMVFTNYLVTFACGAQGNVPLASGGGYVRCPVHGNLVWVSVK